MALSKQGRKKVASLNNYRIFETDQFKKDLEEISRSGQSKIAKKLRDFVYPQLRQHPHFGSNIKKLREKYQLNSLKVVPDASIATDELTVR